MKRRKMEAIEEQNIRELLASQSARGTEPVPDEESDSAVMLTAEVTSADGETLLQRQASAGPSSPLVVDVPRRLHAGDCIRVRGARHLAVHFDANAGESLIHVPEGPWEWTVPAQAENVQSGQTPVPSSALPSDRPRFSFRPLALAELDAYRNVAANSHDCGGSATSFPHATASRESGSDPMFAARCAIDDQDPDGGHGGWLCPSWDAETPESPWWQVDFGRIVEIDKVVIVLRAESPGDSYWREATLVFSDGHRRTIELESTPEPQVFSFDVRRSSSLRLADLVRGEPPGGCVLADVQVWGRDRIPVAEDLSVVAP